MPSFASLLIAAALATFTAAAPISLPDSLPASVPSGSEPSVPALPQVNDIPVVGGQLSSLEAKLRTLSIAIKSIESKIDVRTSTPSVAIIFSDLQTQIQSYTEELTFITPSNISASLVENSVSSIKASIATAVSQLQTLTGQNLSVILAPVEDVVDGQLTVSQVASIVSGDINTILGAAGNVLKATNGADIDIDVNVTLSDLGATVADLVETVDTLVDGLAAELVASLKPVLSIIVELKLTVLINLLGLQL
ncbi:hypothetical protein JVU11DRAFT_8295 [Chiua virens]|nr:hypothetical protein JVU11DRAFT_8295 [Chiua virens]